MRSILLALSILAAASCEMWELPEPSVSVQSVSFDWSNTIWENVAFTVVNTGNVDLTDVSIYYTAVCAGGNFDHVATYPSIYFDMSTPAKPGDQFQVGTALATLTGGATEIRITQIKVTHDFQETTLQVSKTFVKP